MNQLVPPLHSSKETVFCMMYVVRFYIRECVCVCQCHGVCTQVGGQPQVSVPTFHLASDVCGVVSFLLFAVYVRLAGYVGGGSPVFALSVHRNTGIAEAHTCTPLSMGPHSCTAVTCPTEPSPSPSFL